MILLSHMAHALLVLIAPSFLVREDLEDRIKAPFRQAMDWMGGHSRWGIARIVKTSKGWAAGIIYAQIVIEEADDGWWCLNDKEYGSGVLTKCL